MYQWNYSNKVSSYFFVVFIWNILKFNLNLFSEIFFILKMSGSESEDEIFFGPVCTKEELRAKEVTEFKKKNRRTLLLCSNSYTLCKQNQQSV